MDAEILKPEPKRNKGGRPTQYSRRILNEVAELSNSGATNEEIAEALDVNVTTLYSWRNKYPEFNQALKGIKDLADDRVEQSLYQKAMSGDTTAMIFWLKNRRSKEWRDKQDLEHSGEVAVKRLVVDI